MKKDSHLSLYGVGPLYGISISVVTAVAMILSYTHVLQIGYVRALNPVLIVLGVLFVIAAVILWVKAVLVDKIDDSIKQNHLKTTGVYAYCRNPIYTAIWFANIAGLCFSFNVWSLFLAFVYWAYMSVLLKNTEEKWLFEIYGDAYTDYCKRVNRCIPWRRKK